MTNPTRIFSRTFIDRIGIREILIYDTDHRPSSSCPPPKPQFSSGYDNFPDLPGDEWKQD